MCRVSREATLLNMVVTAAPETETELEAEDSASTNETIRYALGMICPGVFLLP
jgi:hypothetical protein